MRRKRKEVKETRSLSSRTKTREEVSPREFRNCRKALNIETKRIHVIARLRELVGRRKEGNLRSLR